MSVMQKIKAIFDVPKLHARIDELEAELKERPVINRDNFYDVAKSVDLEGIRDEIAERIIEEFKPFMERHAIECLKEAFRDDGRNKPAFVDVAYDVSEQAVAVNAILPRFESRFQVYSPRF